MTGARTYLDHNATTALRPEARHAVIAALEHVGAASSVHKEGRTARAMVETARAQVAALVGARADDVRFVGSATEANNTAISPHWTGRGEHRPLDRCILSAIEHASVLASARFEPARRETLPVAPEGVVDPVAWSDYIRTIAAAGERPLVSLMLANNETGAVQPVAEVARATRAASGLLHCDAAQAAGKIVIAMPSLGADLLSLSSHKIGGPGGTGALVLSADWHLGDPLVRGGGQEGGLRAGTENIPAIVGFGAAAEAARTEIESEGARQRGLRDRLEEGVRAGGASIFAGSVERLPNTSCFSQPGVPAETALIALDLEGIAVSSGSACSSGKVGPSHVLDAMQVPRDVAAGAIRISVGRTTTQDDVERFLDVWKRVVEVIHGRRKARAA